MTIELWEASVPKEGAPWAGFEKYMGWVDGHVKFAETHPSHTVDTMALTRTRTRTRTRTLTRTLALALALTLTRWM